MSDEKIINWGILGCGKIAHSFAKGLKITPRAKLEAVASKSGKAEAFGKTYGVEKRYSNYDDLVQDPAVDIVYVATTHNFHFNHTLLCLEHDKPVLCEKPFTVNAVQAEHLINTARNRKLFLMEGMWSRYIPGVAKIREMIHDQGILGEIRHFKADFSLHFRVPDEHRIMNPNLAGGCLLDLGIYPISFCNMVFKEAPKKIMSSGTIGKTGVDVFSSYLFEYKSGATAMMTSSSKITMPHDAYIFGTKGYIRIPNFSRPTRIQLYLEGKEREVIEVPFDLPGFNYEAIEACNCLRSGKMESDIMPLNETLEIMKILDTLRSQWDFKYPGEP